MSDAWLFLFSVIVSAVLLFAMVFFIIMFSDLECDYINPIDLCQKLNQFILPEYAAHAVLTLVFLLHFSWFALMLNLPLAGYHLRKWYHRTYVYDPTDIFRLLQHHKRESLAKLGFYLICFFYYLYRMIVGLLTQ
ncbi:hypothetical protein HMI55_005884 [Coelomomyces lativittatus]|nr:hypothetical protein HMI55_005884 [Coelomomyces lativittatus]